MREPWKNTLVRRGKCPTKGGGVPVFPPCRPCAPNHLPAGEPGEVEAGGCLRTYVLAPWGPQFLQLRSGQVGLVHYLGMNWEPPAASPATYSLWVHPLAFPPWRVLVVIWFGPALASLDLLGSGWGGLLLICCDCLQFILSSGIYQGSGLGDCTRLLRSDAWVHVGGPLTSCVYLGKLSYLSVSTFSSPK